MSQAAAGASAGCRCKQSRSVPLLLAAGCCCWPSLAAQAQDAAPAPAAIGPRVEAPLRMELDASLLPRIGSPDAPGTQPPRVGLSLLPARGSGLGPAMGMTGFSLVPPTGPVTPELQPRPSLDLGVHWRHTFDSSQQIDVTAWRRLNAGDDAYSLAQQRQPVYGARVEMRLQPASRSGFLADRGFIGLQLQGGARISIKRRNGKPMVYYRTTF